MSSKIGENTCGGTPHLSNPRSWSITGRLTLLYTLSTLGVLVLSAVLLYWALVGSLRRAEELFLAEEIHELRDVLQNSPDKTEGLKQEVRWEKGFGKFRRSYTRILDEAGRTLIETKGMDDIVPASRFPTPVGATKNPKKGVRWGSNEGIPYVMMAAWAPLDRSGENQWVVQVLLDVSHEDALIAEYRRTLVLVLLLGTLFSAGVGYSLARRGMKPVAEITTAARRISANHLQERIAPAGWPKELASLATAFDDMLDRLEDSFTRLLQFSADLAHELRTPINNLMGEAEVALSRNRTPDEYRQILGSSLEEYARLSRLLEDLLFLARAENAQLSVERSLINGRKEMEAVREFYEALAEEQGVEILCQGNAQLSADSVLFRQAFSNLLSNALRYTPRNGKILLSIKQSQGEWIEMTVNDTGSGIDPEHLPRLFDRFYHVDSPRSRKTSGTGLGLSIVRSIMGLHGGTVAIQSEPGTGTTVTLRFPPPA